jgi:NADPH2 dehydrogenase
MSLVFLFKGKNKPILGFMKTELSRFSVLQLNQNHALKNRVVVPPMASSTATTEGFVTARTVEHYGQLSESGAGLVIAEYTFVHASGRSEENQLGISQDAHIAGLALVAARIHQSGALAGIQLSHAGGKSDRLLTGGRLLGASAIAVPAKGEALEVPDAMLNSDIELVQRSFVEAVDRAVGAGFDLVEFHSAHGYGLNQFLSPITNQRADEYGVTLEGRFRLLREIIAIVRQNHPRLILSVRMPGKDFLEGGLELADTIKTAQSLEILGVNLIHVSSGIGGWRRPSTRVGEGYLVEEAVKIQEQVEIPVIGVGGIESGDYIDEQIRKGRISLAAVGRAILKDPRSWFQNNLLSGDSNYQSFQVLSP